MSPIPTKITISIFPSDKEVAIKAEKQQLSNNLFEFVCKSKKEKEKETGPTGWNSRG
jgi:translation elongation factor EF-1beta